VASFQQAGAVVGSAMRAPPRERRYASDLGLVGFDQEIEGCRIDIAFLSQDGLERAYTQFGFGQFRMVVIMLMMMVVGADIG